MMVLGVGFFALLVQLAMFQKHTGAANIPVIPAIPAFKSF
jgi:hypothetical protein